MTSPLPQFYPNTLRTAGTTDEALRSTLSELRDAVEGAAQRIEEQPIVNSEQECGDIFDGQLGKYPVLISAIYQLAQNRPLGIAVLYLYLSRHATSGAQHYLTAARRRIPDRSEKKWPFLPGKCSPLTSEKLASAFLRLGLAKEADSEDVHHDLALLQEAAEFALQQPDTVPLGTKHTKGTDEVLTGRAGLLWSLLLLRDWWDDGDFSSMRRDVFAAIPKLVNVIIEAGLRSSEKYASANGESGRQALMWTWLNDFYGFGGMHGSTGILSVLLCCKSEEIESYLPQITDSIKQLSELTVSSDGHLPMSSPPWPSPKTRTSPLVQICHGAPGILLLLACAMRQPSVRTSLGDIHDVVDLATKRVWEEGLLSKGGGVCHGIAGNALSWVILASAEGETSHLQYALPFLLWMRETQPSKENEEFRMPDHPYSLFEGLAGTALVWAYSCNVIEDILGRHKPTI
ncbi:hypothetical protein NA57DRAFT_62525 [Rhizodiscina lignyota]|uniref:Lanthionine synthetase C family protein n=1 Tax=Rhizodiscina lignyota TaxID=1504668 RepID=A0A9P4I476_9PEZI|nr:hypothetical protein NA57DRAFT_62525 [Rhizodiscina lignyota]